MCDVGSTLTTFSDTFRKHYMCIIYKKPLFYIEKWMSTSPKNIKYCLCFIKKNASIKSHSPNPCRSFHEFSRDNKKGLQTFVYTGGIMYELQQCSFFGNFFTFLNS